MLQSDSLPTRTTLREVYSVSRLNLEVRALLDANFPPTWVEGEISNLARPRSGHIYFSLKDENCQVRCAMFRMNLRKLDFEPENGQQVLVRATVGLYPERGEFQLVVQHMEEAGTGALQRAFEALKARLDKEGLFAPEHKQDLPALPRRVGVITSPTGAAVRDIINVLQRRFALADVLIYPVPVQGPGAADQIAAALARAGRRNECDVLIVGRGGGSLEDLWPFNEEVVARAIHHCPVPVVSAVGHEIDFTIADFVADQRAPTPSAAAELITPDSSEWLEWLAGTELSLLRHMRRRVESAGERLRLIQRRLVHPKRRLHDHAQKLDGLNHRLDRAIQLGKRQRRTRLDTITTRLRRQDPALDLRAKSEHLLTLRARLYRGLLARRQLGQNRLNALRRTLVATGPENTLQRGYAIVSREDDGKIVRDAGEVRSGDALEARLATGTIKALVK